MSLPSSNPAIAAVRGASSRCQWNGPRRSAGAVCSQKLSGAPAIAVLTATSARRSAGARAPTSATRKSASCAAGASHSSPLKRLASGAQAAHVAAQDEPVAGGVLLVAEDAAAVAVAVPLGLEELVEQQRRHHRRGEQLLVRVFQRGPRACAEVADQRHRRRTALHLGGDPALPHAEHLGESIVSEVLELRLVCGRVHDHLVTPVEGRVLVGHDAHPPPGAVGDAAAWTQRVHLRRRQRLVAGAEGTRRRGREVSLRVRRPRRPRGGHDRELAVDRVAAELARRRRPPPSSPVPVGRDREAVAAAVLGRVHGVVGALERRAVVGVVRLDQRPAGRHGDAQPAFFGRGEP